MAERDEELQLWRSGLQSLQTAPRSRICLFLPAFIAGRAGGALRSAAKAGVHIELYGGMDGAERCMGRFGDPEEFGYEEPFPICAVKSSRWRKNLRKISATGILWGDSKSWDRPDNDRGYLCGGQMRVCVLYVYDVCIFTGNSRTGAPYKGALRAGKRAGGAAGEKTFLPGRACGEPALRRNCERGLRLSRSQKQDAFHRKGLYQRRLTENGSQMLKDGDTVSVEVSGKFIFRGEKHNQKGTA